MKKITIDMETRSRVELKASGSHVYACDPSTQVFCVAVKEGGGQTRIWVADYFLDIMNTWLHSTSVKTQLQKEWASFQRDYVISEEEAQRILSEADTVEAHNANFEMDIYAGVLKTWPRIPLRKWRCSAAKAAAAALPRSLAGAGNALGLIQRKDKQGYFNMMKLCKPRKPTKNNAAEWNEDPEDLLNLFKYCMQDVDSEYELSQALPDLNNKEQEVWFVDRIINSRGLGVDVEAAKGSMKIIEEYNIRLLAEFEATTGGEVSSPRKVAKTLDWLRGQGLFEIEDLKSDTVKEYLKRDDLTPEAVRVLEIRQSLSKSSTAKFSSMVGANSDQRLRGTTMYHGATTGRWAGRRIQPHNMPRKMPDNYEGVVELSKAGDLETLELLYGDPMQALSGSIRAFIQASPGHELLCADYSSIEGRKLAWLAGEEYVVQNYVDGKDAYCVFSSQITGVDYEEILSGYEKGEAKYDAMRFEGKTGELACGYQGGQAAIARFAPNMPISRREEIVQIWRANRPETVKFWSMMEEMALSAVHTKKVYTYNNIKWGVRGEFLHCVLPSGRILSYYDPQVLVKETPWGEQKASTSFMGVDERGKWSRQYTYGGKLVENIVQAVARDLLAEALLRLESKGYKVVLHVHDEIIVEVKAGTGSVEELISIMCEAPDWAIGCPVAASGFRTKRYHK